MSFTSTDVVSRQTTLTIRKIENYFIVFIKVSKNYFIKFSKVKILIIQLDITMITYFEKFKV